MTSGVPRAVRVVAVLALLFGSLFLSAGPAQAGGPTSAILVSPSTGRTAALYYSDAEYDRLSTALGGYQPAADPTIENPNLLTAPGSGSITVTWLIHDVSVWRIDRIFFTDSAGPLIVTQESMDGRDPGDGMYPGGTGNDTAVWHRPPDPQELQTLLAELGLTGPGQQRMTVDGAAAPVAAEADSAGAGSAGAVTDVETVATAASEPVDPADRAGVVWWWVLGGLLAGVVLTAAAVRFVPAVRDQLLGRSADAGPVRMVEVSG